MAELLLLPTKPRNKIEEGLLEEIAADPNLENSNLRNKVIEYAASRYSLVVWHHFPATLTRYSFENPALTRATYNSYNGNRPTPRIVGILAPSSM